MNKTKIDWCDMTWNPVTGCLHGCEYCYARKIAERFGKHMPVPDGTKLAVNDGLLWSGQKIAYPYDFLPTFHRYRLDEPARIKKPQTIFVCSMADLFGDWVPDEWIQAVYKACEAAPWHTFLFLTKNPVRYRKIQSKGMLPHEHWYGTTATVNCEYFSHSLYRTFVSIEPMLRPVVVDRRPQQALPEWVIIGAETGNSKDRVVPEKKWIDDVAIECKRGSVPIFMKESLRRLMDIDFVQEFPWEVS